MKVYWLTELSSPQQWSRAILVPTKLLVTERVLLDKEYREKLLYGGILIPEVLREVREMRSKADRYFPCHLIFRLVDSHTPIIKPLTRKEARNSINFLNRTNQILENITEENYVMSYFNRTVSYSNIRQVVNCGVLDIPQLPEYYTEEMDGDGEKINGYEKVGLLLPKEKEVS